MKILKTFFFLIILLVFFLSSENKSFGQAPTPTPTPKPFYILYKESNTVNIAVGNARLPTGTRYEVVTWATKINDVLQRGRDNKYNKQTAIFKSGNYTAAVRQGLELNADIYGLYWNTYLIIDAFSLAGIPGLNIPTHGVVNSMIKDWKARAGFSFTDYSTNKKILTSIEPGFVIFFQRQKGVESNDDHVAIIKAVVLDSQGNGFVETLDANMTSKTARYIISEYEFQSTPNNTSVVGFGDFANTTTNPTGQIRTPSTPGKFSCPLSGGRVTCGSYYTRSSNGCGHCQPPQYDPTEEQCNAAYTPGTRSAIDVGIVGAGKPGNMGKPLALPSFGGNTIEWTYTYEGGRANTERIAGFAGQDTVTRTRYYLQFHHSLPPTIAIGTKFVSGDIVANICRDSTGYPSNCDHSHMQILEGASQINHNLWLDAASVFDCPL